MRVIEGITRDPLLKLTALVLAFLLWALVETGGRSAAVVPGSGRSQPDPGPAGTASATTTRSVPVAVRLTGQPAPGWELAGPARIDPLELTVSGPVRAVERVDTVRLPAVRLDGRSASATLDLEVDTAGLGLTVTPTRVRVTIPIRQIPTEMSGGGVGLGPDPASPPAGGWT